MARLFKRKKRKSKSVAAPIAETRPMFSTRSDGNDRYMHAYQPGKTADTWGTPTATSSSIPSAAARPIPSPTSAPLTTAFDDDAGGRTPSISPGIWSPGDGIASNETESQYVEGLGADTGNFFSDMFQTVAEGYKARQQAKTAAANRDTAVRNAEAYGTARRPPYSAGLLGMSTTTWIMLAGGGVAAFLLLSRKKRR